MWCLIPDEQKKAYQISPIDPMLIKVDIISNTIKKCQHQKTLIAENKILSLINKRLTCTISPLPIPLTSF